MKKIKVLGEYFYNMMEITLDSGRLINLTRLNQWRTYTSQLEGIPRYSQQLVDKIRIETQEKSGNTIIIDASPAPLPISDEYTESLRQRDIMSGGPHPCISLAPVTVVAHFDSLPTVPGEDQGTSDWSRLTMVWFQELFAMPINENILTKIKAVDWDRVAQNWGF